MIFNKKLTKKDIYMATKNAVHVLEQMDKKIKVDGLSFKEVTTSDGEVKNLAFIVTGKKAIYGSSVSFFNSCKELEDIFAEEIENGTLEITIKKEKTRNGEIYTFNF